MIYDIRTTSYLGAPLNVNEVFRYSGAKATDDKLKTLLADCVKEAEKENALNYSVCYTETPLSLEGDKANFSAFILKSKDLVRALNGAKSALIFACTLGVGIDRLIKKYSEINPSRALIFQALGAERIETFTDLFVSDYKKRNGVKLSPRFSAGYGDLDLSAQKDIFALLTPEKRIGLTLNGSLLMSPSKSVTAITGINGNVKEQKNCANCNERNCAYRR